MVGREWGGKTFALGTTAGAVSLHKGKKSIWSPKKKDAFYETSDFQVKKGKKKRRRGGRGFI